MSEKCLTRIILHRELTFVVFHTSILVFVLVGPKYPFLIMGRLITASFFRDVMTTVIVLRLINSVNF